MIVLIIQKILYYLVGLSCAGMSFFSFFFKNTKYFNTHTGRGKNVLKKLIVMLLVYIQKGHYYFLFGLMGIKFLIEFKQSFENQSKLTKFKHAHFNTILWPMKILNPYVNFGIFRMSKLIFCQWVLICSKMKFCKVRKWSTHSL